MCIFTVARRDFVKSVRLSGTVEAVQSMTISAPRLTGPNSGSLMITHLVRPGSTVRPGDHRRVRPQEQMKNALDRRAELQDLEQQMRSAKPRNGAARMTKGRSRSPRAPAGPSSR